MRLTSFISFERTLQAFTLLAAACSAGAVDIIAHRGASHDAPENTLAAFKLGWEQGAEAVELDIWLTRDGRIGVMHDETARRTTGVDRKISELSLAELTALDAGKWFGPRWAGEKVPRFEEVLAVIPPGRKLVIEIKCGPEILPELERVIKASGRKATELIIISFKHESVVGAKKAFSDVPVFLLSGFKQDKQTGAWTPTFEELIGKAKAARADGINVSFKGPITAEVIRQTHRAGLKFLVWTVNDADIAKRLAADGVDAITTDRPAWLREQIKAP
jgi:glycerophosphoryl diester phosphodiesterase